MENAQLIGLSRQIALKRQMDVLANNLANVNTAGFKGDSLLFEEHLSPVARVSGAQGADARLSYVQDGSLARDFSEGPMQQTGGEFDVALSGDGFLVVQSPQGPRYTRNGELKLDAGGQLVTNTGYPVMGDGGPITFSANETGIEIAKDGTISTTQGQKGRLQVVKFANNNLLKKTGDTLFTTTQAPQPASDVKVLQGMVEGSNVKSVLEMTHMLETVRAYTAMTQTMEQTDKLRQTAIEQLGGAGA